MTTQQTFSPFKILTFLFFLRIGDSMAQNDIQVVIQNDASEYPTLLCNYFKKHKAIFDRCGLRFAVKLEDNLFNCNGIGLNCTFGLKKDSFSYMIKNCRSNQITQHHEHNSTTEKSDSTLYAKWDNDFLNLLFQIDTSLIPKVTDFKPLSPLLKNKEKLLTHDNLLKNSQLCDLLDASDTMALKYFAKNRRLNDWRKLFLSELYSVLTVPFDNQCCFKPLKYLTNIEEVQLNKDWIEMKTSDIEALKNANILVIILRKEERKDEKRANNLKNQLLQSGINDTKIEIRIDPYN